jgi:hypothetical protein
MLSWFCLRGRSISAPAADSNPQPTGPTPDSGIIHASVLPSDSRPPAVSENTPAGEVRDSVSSGVLKAIAG